jgi:hypothetical protein
VIFWRVSGELGSRLPLARAEFDRGYHLAFLIAAGLVVAAIVVALTVIQPEKQADSAPEAEPEPARAQQPAYSKAV